MPRPSLIESYQPFPSPEGAQAGFRHFRAEDSTLVASHISKREKPGNAASIARQKVWGVWRLTEDFREEARPNSRRKRSRAAKAAA
jgi:hypothetical protein